MELDLEQLIKKDNQIDQRFKLRLWDKCEICEGDNAAQCDTQKGQAICSRCSRKNKAKTVDLTAFQFNILVYNNHLSTIKEQTSLYEKLIIAANKLIDQSYQFKQKVEKQMRLKQHNAKNQNFLLLKQIVMAKTALSEASLKTEKCEAFRMLLEAKVNIEKAQKQKEAFKTHLKLKEQQLLSMMFGWYTVLQKIDLQSITQLKYSEVYPYKLKKQPAPILEFGKQLSLRDHSIHLKDNIVQHTLAIQQTSWKSIRQILIKKIDKYNQIEQLHLFNQ